MNNFERKIVIFYPSYLTFVLGTQMDCLIEKISKVGIQNSILFNFHPKTMVDDDRSKISDTSCIPKLPTDNIGLDKQKFSTKNC